MMTGTVTHSIQNVSQITINPACSLGTAQMAYGRRELMVYEPEDVPESKDGHRGKSSEQ
jgi:hypothetical protein